MMSDRKTKRLSGHQYRLKKQQRIESDKKQSSTLLKFLKKDEPQSSLESEITSEASTSKASFDDINFEIPPSYSNEEGLEISDEEELGGSKDEEQIGTSKSCFDDDPGTWPEFLPRTQIDYFVEHPPKQLIFFKFPINENGKKFSKSHYERRLPNSEFVKRPWLFYSKLKNKIYCLFCKAFTSRTDQISPLISGFNDWNHTSQSLTRHETSFLHVSSCARWFSLQNSLTSKNTIDADFQKMIEKEQKIWNDILSRIIAVVQFLSRQSLAFRGSSANVFDDNNGNFLKALEAISKFDPVMRQHLDKVAKHQNQKTKTSPHYLSNVIQNEIIQILSQSVLNEILNMAKESKYFSLILDCTPDTSHTEQISVVIRFVVCRPSPQIHEHFLGFCIAHETTGEAFFNFVMQKFNELYLDIDNLRGQSYDNGSNMKGKHCGLQKRILDINPRARFVPCSAHSLNLVVNDAAKVTVEVADFFNTVQQLFCFFSGSTKRWEVLKEKVVKLNLKPLSTTRWESRVEAIRPIVESIGEIYDALIEITERTDPTTGAEARAIATRLTTLEFCVAAIVWHAILSRVNVVSNILQDPQCELSTAALKMGMLKEYFSELRTDESYENFLKLGEELSKEVDGATEFKPQRIKKRKRNFSYEGEDEQINDPKSRFKVQFYLPIIDQIISSIQERFVSLNEHLNTFGIMHTFQKIWDLDDEQIKAHCNDLHLALKNKNNTGGDIEGSELFQEIKILKSLIDPQKTWSAMDVLTHLVINKMDTSFPNLFIVLRIFLTLPVSVAGSERSFSKLKLIKNYLRSTMSQERLKGLSILAIEHKLLDLINLSDSINQFSAYKARKIVFS